MIKASMTPQGILTITSDSSEENAKLLTAIFGLPVSVNQETTQEHDESLALSLTVEEAAS